MKRRILSVFMIACLAFMLCASAYAADDISGKYYAESCSRYGEPYICEGEYIELNSDGTGSVMFTDSLCTLTWTMNGNEFYFIDSEGYEMEGTIENGIISGVYASFDYVYKLDSDIQPIGTAEGSDEINDTDKASEVDGGLTVKEFFEQYGPCHSYRVYSCFYEGYENNTAMGHEDDYVYLNEDGTGMMLRENDAYNIVWSLNGIDFYMQDNMGNIMNGTLENGVISGSISGLDYELIITSTEPYAVDLSPSTWGKGLDHVTDAADILTDDEEDTLADKAKTISDLYGCEVYIITLDNFEYFSSRPYIESCADEIRACYDLGRANDYNIIMLLMSMSGRDYTLLAHGDFGNASFTDYGKDKVENAFLDDFAQNSWYDGFDDYLDMSEKLLIASEKGEPIDVNNDPPPVIMTVLFALILGFIPAIIISCIMRSGLKSVSSKSEANNYLAQNGVNISYRNDKFSHTTQTSVYDPPQKSSSGGGGGTSTSRSGSSSSSGKF